MMSLLVHLFVSASLVLAADDLPRVDLHVHLDSEQNPTVAIKPSEAADLSRKLGVRLGVLGEGGCVGEIHDDKTLRAFLDGFAGVELFRGLQIYGFDWPRCFSKDNLAQLDYIAADALVFPDRNGKSVRLWLPGVEFADPQDFMDRYVEFNVKVLAQPIQIWANATFLPISLQSRYEELWSDARMERVIGAAVRNGIAIEINARYRIPSARFIRKAKAAGAKFSFGSNAHIRGMGEIGYCLDTARSCGLSGKDIWLPSSKVRR
jgi:hypothetical protein